jgi:hypothetical protein
MGVQTELSEICLNTNYEAKRAASVELIVSCYCDAIRSAAMLSADRWVRVDCGGTIRRSRLAA